MSVAALGDCSNATLSVHGREQSSRKVGTFAKIKNQSKVFVEIYYSLQFIRYTQHMYTYDMRRNKHNIQTYYRARLFWLNNDNDRENK